MSALRHLRGSIKHCPKCASSAIAYDPNKRVKGYGPGLALCLNCKTLYEPFLPEQLWDPSEPMSSFKDPCNNCAFRPGSPEQKDPIKWRGLIDELKEGHSFYCHKGVPIDADAEHGFAYPQKRVPVELGDVLKTTVLVQDRSKLRLCRGYLNMMGKRGAKDADAA